MEGGLDDLLNQLNSLIQGKDRKGESSPDILLLTICFYLIVLGLVTGLQDGGEGEVEGGAAVQPNWRK